MNAHTVLLLDLEVNEEEEKLNSRRCKVDEDNETHTKLMSVLIRVVNVINL